LLAPIADRHLALFVDFDNRMRVYLVDSGGMLFGLLMNPPENSNNMITVRTLKLYQDALRLFAILRVPVVSFLDTPGVDPRMDNSNQDVIQQMISTNRAIIEYPFPKMGVWIGRGFGGANTLVIPSVYGSLANYVILDRTTLGVMHESIIAHLLEKSKRMLQLWQKSRETESEDFNDIVEAGIATRAIQLEELPSVIRCFLLGQEPAQQMASFSVASLADDQESTVCV
jgi:acetyl-CoA carboxylase carboxyltransferase component